MVGDTQNAFEIANSTGLPGAEGTAPAAPPTPPPAAAGAPATSPEQLVEIKWNGKTEKVPLAQAIELAQKGYDYTQKMQDLARQREGFGAERQRYEAAIQEVRTFLQDKARVRQYLQELEGGAASGTSAAAGAPEETVITQAELEARIQRAREEMAGMLRTEQETLRMQIQTETLAGQYARELDGFIDGLKKSVPELRAIPRVEALLKQDVRAMGPKNLEEAKQMMRNVAQEHARSVRDFLAAERKGTTEPGAPNPLANGIEPKGGGQVLPPAPAQKFKSMKDPDFRAAVLHDIQFGPGR
jgi:hypothetical protein